MPATHGSRWRLALALFLAGFLGIGALVAWRGDGVRAPAGDAAIVFEEVRADLLAGDADALWKRLDAEGRERYGDYVDTMRKSPDGTDAQRWRAAVGVSREDFMRLPPERLMARECEVLRGLLEGGRVHRTVPQSDDEAVLELVYRDGSTHWWHVGQTQGRWVVRNLAALMDRDGRLLEDARSRFVAPKAKDLSRPEGTR